MIFSYFSDARYTEIAKIQQTAFNLLILAFIWVLK